MSSAVYLSIMSVSHEASMKDRQAHTCTGQFMTQSRQIQTQRFRFVQNSASTEHWRNNSLNNLYTNQWGLIIISPSLCVQPSFVCGLIGSLLIEPLIGVSLALRIGFSLCVNHANWLPSPEIKSIPITALWH